MARSSKIEARVPWPLITSVEDQFEGGKESNLPYRNHGQFCNAFYLWQSVYGTEHPFTEGYSRLSLAEQDKIHDFIEGEHQAGRVKRGQLVKRLAAEAGITGEESFQEHGRKLFDALQRLANED